MSDDDDDDEREDWESDLEDYLRRHNLSEDQIRGAFDAMNTATRRRAMAVTMIITSMTARVA